MGQANKFITNVLATYVRMALTIGIGLLTTRLLLDMLGAVDFGLYFVLGGGISLIMVISSALSDAAQRHMAFEIGRGDEIALRQVFATSVIIYLGLGVVITGVGLALRPAFLYGLTIPEERFQAAAWVYDLALLNMSLSVLATPFLAVFLARQAMVQDAVFALLNSVASLVAVLLAPRIHADVLIGYAMLIAASRLIFMALQILRGLILFPETRFRIKHVKRNRMRELVGFAGWSFLGSLAWQLRIQGGQIVLNLFFGPSVNAAYAIANQAGMYINNFLGAVVKASRPIMSGFQGKGDKAALHRMVTLSSKIITIAGSLIAVPLIVEIDFVLAVWLAEVPENVALFVILTLSWILIINLTSGHASGVIALGEIGKVTRYGSLITVSPVPLGLILFGLYDLPPETYLYLINIAALSLVAFRVPYIGRMLDLPAKRWLSDVVLSVMPAVGCSVAISIVVHFLVPAGVARLCILSVCATTVLLFVVWNVSLNVDEKAKIVRFLVSVKKRV